MNISKIDYFFHEWLILSKGISKEQYENLTEYEFLKLKCEFMKIYKTT